MAVLGTVGIADKGIYNPTEIYKKGNFVLHNDSTWIVLANELTGVAPVDDGINWKYLAKGASILTDTKGLLGVVGASVSNQALTDEISERVSNELILKTAISSTQVNDPNKVTGSDLTHSMNETLTTTVNNLNRVTNRKIIFLGDSYSTGYVVGQAENNSNWMDNAISYLNDSTITFYKCQKGGTAFGDSRLEYTFLQQLKDWESAVTDKNSITDIMVFGGRNDFQFSLNQVIAGISAFIGYCKTTYPHALVHIGMIGGYSTGDYVDMAKKTVDAYAWTAQLGGCFINNAQYSLRDTIYMSIDEIHPSEYGQQMLGKNIANYIKNGNITTSLHLDKSADYFTSTLTPLNNDNKLMLEQFLTNSLVSIVSVSPSCYVSSAELTVACTGGEFILGNLTRTLIVGSSFAVSGVYAPVVLYTSDGYYHTIISQICIKNKLLIIKPTLASNTGGYETYLNVTRIYIPPFTIVGNV